MPLIEDPERMRQVEEELAHTWTKYRAGDVCLVVGGNAFLGEEVTIKFPYAFSIDREQGYVAEETPCAFAESELQFVRQDLYRNGGKSKVKQSYQYVTNTEQAIAVNAASEQEADHLLVKELVELGYLQRA